MLCRPMTQRILCISSDCCSIINVGYFISLSISHSVSTLCSNSCRRSLKRFPMRFPRAWRSSPLRALSRLVNQRNYTKLISKLKGLKNNFLELGVSTDLNRPPESPVTKLCLRQPLSFLVVVHSLEKNKRSSFLNKQFSFAVLNKERSPITAVSHPES